MTTISQIADYLATHTEQTVGGLQFECYPIQGDVEVLQVNVVGREELPIFVSVTDSQILCICYLWRDEEVKADQRLALYESMLTLNIPIPLSAFGKIDQQYVLYGALATQSGMEDVIHELQVLSDNSLEVIEEMSDYLI